MIIQKATKIDKFRFFCGLDFRETTIFFKFILNFHFFSVNQLQNSTENVVFLIKSYSFNVQMWGEELCRLKIRVDQPRLTLNCKECFVHCFFGFAWCGMPSPEFFIRFWEIQKSLTVRKQRTISSWSERGRLFDENDENRT